MLRISAPFPRISLLLLALALPAAASAQKTDVVVLINGDSITGEIKSLEFGTLEYGTDSMGTVNIDWEDVTSVTSRQTFEVETSSGTRYFGNLLQPPDVDTVSVGRGESVQDLAMGNVVRITPIDTDERFVDRLDGSVTFGFDTGKASEVTTSRLNANVRYRAREFLVGLSLSSTITDQPGAETTKRQSLGMNYSRFRANRWFTDWFATVEQNEELGINSRVSVGGGLGRYLVQTNRNQLSLLGGLNLNRESFTTSEPSANNPEAKLSVKYLHRSTVPESNVTLTGNVFVRLDDPDTYRSETDLSFRREFVDDLIFDLTLYYSSLSDPPPGAAKDDYGVTTSLGYSF